MARQCGLQQLQSSWLLRLEANREASGVRHARGSWTCLLQLRLDTQNRAVCHRSLLRPAGLWSTNGRWISAPPESAKQLFFMITATEAPAPVQAPEIPNQPAAAPKPEAEPATRLWKISGEAVSPKRALMKSQRRLQKISARISLVILTLGFSFLGLLSFVNKPQADLATVSCVDSASSIAGSAASLLAGTTFLVASCVFWRRCTWIAP